MGLHFPHLCLFFFLRKIFCFVATEQSDTPYHAPLRAIAVIISLAGADTVGQNLPWVTLALAPVADIADADSIFQSKYSSSRDHFPTLAANFMLADIGPRSSKAASTGCAAMSFWTGVSEGVSLFFAFP